MGSLAPAYPSLLLAGAAVVLVLVIYLGKRRRGPVTEVPVSVEYGDAQWKRALRDGETVVAEAPAFSQLTWLGRLLWGSFRRSSLTPYQLGYTSRGAFLIAERGMGRLWGIERHERTAVAIARSEPERTGSPYVFVELMVHAKKRTFLHVPPVFISELRRGLGG